MVVEMIVRVNAPGPQVPELLTQEQAIESKALKDVWNALNEYGIYLIGVSLLKEEIAESVFKAENGGENPDPIHAMAIQTAA